MSDEVTPEQIVLDAECYLGDWSRAVESAKSYVDPKATFFFPDDADIEPLTRHQIRKGQGKRQPGKRFRLVLIEIGDDERPVTQEKDYADNMRGHWCIDAIEHCNAPDFQEFMLSVYAAEGMSAHYAGKALKAALGITTRKAIDQEPDTREAYRQLLDDYRAWLREHGRAGFAG